MAKAGWQGMKWVRMSSRLALYAACGFCCIYCGKDAATADARFSLDHLAPREHGGTNAPENLAMACLSCNDRKGARHVSEYLTVLAAGGVDVAPVEARLGARAVVLDRELGRKLAAARDRGASIAKLAKLARARKRVVSAG